MNIADVVKRKLTDIFGHELLNSDKNVRKAYVMKLEDDEVLKKVALGDHDEDIGVWAVDGISDYSMLEEISKSEKFCVSRAAKRKISNLE